MEIPRKEDKVPITRRPSGMSLEGWQSLLRKQFANFQTFRIKNIGNHPFFSDFEVYNPESGNAYKVSIRDNIGSFNFCSCPDFTITALGTCKHIEYVLLRFSRYKKYNKYFTSRQNNNYSSLSVYYGIERKIRLKKADSISSFDNENDYFDREGFLFQDRIKDLDSFIRRARATDPLLKIYPDIFEMIEQYRRDEARRRKVTELFPEYAESHIFENLIKTTLYPYQKQGVISILEAGRVLLADDMGLGKTIQTIAAVEIFINHLDVSRVLIVCPTSLKYQWKSEIEKFTGRNSTIVEGLIHIRKELYKQEDFIKIISYGASRNDLEFINEWSPELVILDEAQRIKNWKTVTARSVKKIRSEFAVVLTGTPLENRIDEIHSIVEYIDRYRLGALFRFLDKHQITDEHGKLSGYKNLREINKTLDGILIRRTRREISDQLPDRVDKTFFVEMTEEQKTDHNSYYDQVSQLVNKWIRTSHLSEEERQKLLVCLNCMRMVCDSTYILNPKTNYGNKISEIIVLIDDLLENPENRLVIFSQWKRMFQLLITELRKRNLPFEYLHGDLQASERKTVIERFASDLGVRIFLSTDAGGVGVNLQSANMLINIDLPWNPAVLEQRIGRIYRLGQKKHINVFNFISRDSIEHRILYLLGFKKSVFSGVIEEEGKDEVMLEGFMESVRTLAEIDPETFGGYSSKKNSQEPYYEIPDNNTVKESDSLYQSGTTEDIKTSEGSEKDEEGQSPGSFLSRMGSMLKRFASSILKRL